MKKFSLYFLIISLLVTFPVFSASAEDAGVWSPAKNILLIAGDKIMHKSN